MRSWYLGWWGVVVVVLAALIGCAEATIVGNDLLEDEVQIVGFTDSFEIRARSVMEDSILTHSMTAGSQILRHVVGNLDDPYFGTSSSVVTSQMFLNGVGSEFLDFEVDSVVITLAYFPGFSYGELNEPISFAAYQSFTDLDITQDYYSTDKFSRNFAPMAERLDFIPNLVDSVRVRHPGSDSSLQAPQLRIRCNDNFVQTMIRQTPGTFEFQDSFARWFPAIQLLLSEGDNSMLAFDLNNPASGMTVYYHDPNNTVYRDYQFVFTGLFLAHVQVATFQHDYTGSIAEDYLDDVEKGDDLLFVQSMSGLNTEFEVIGLENFDDVLINQAILEFTIAELPDNDTMTYPFINRVQTRILDDDGSLINSRDVSLALGISEIDAFGGLILEDDETGKLIYQMNVTASVQDIIAGREGNKIFLSSFQKQNEASRVLLYGPGHDQFPAKLNLTFTKIR